MNRVVLGDIAEIITGPFGSIGNSQSRNSISLAVSSLSWSMRSRIFRNNFSYSKTICSFGMTIFNIAKFDSFNEALVEAIQELCK